MEVELEPRVKPLAYKVKAMSRESPAQKAAHLLDTDLRNHWSTATNTKEWILLELDVCFAHAKLFFFPPLNSSFVFLFSIHFFVLSFLIQVVGVRES